MRVGVVVAGAAVVAVTIVVASAAREGEPNVLLSITDAASVERDAGERALVFTGPRVTHPGRTRHCRVRDVERHGLRSARLCRLRRLPDLRPEHLDAHGGGPGRRRHGRRARRDVPGLAVGGERGDDRRRGRGRHDPRRRRATTRGRADRGRGRHRLRPGERRLRGRAGRRSRVPPARNLEPPRPRTLRRRARPRRPPVRGCDAGEVRRLLRTVVGAGEVDHAAGSRQPRVPNGRRGGLLPVLRRRGRRPGEGVLQLRPRRVARRRAELELRGDRGCGAGSPQERWLRADLAANPASCTLAYWHHPRFSSGEHGSDSTYTAFWQALYEANADVVLVGHDHDYERFAPQRARRRARPRARHPRVRRRHRREERAHVSEGSTEQRGPGRDEPRRPRADARPGGLLVGVPPGGRRVHGRRLGELATERLSAGRGRP